MKHSNYTFVSTCLVLGTVSHNIAGIGAVWFQAGRIGLGNNRMVHNMSKDPVYSQEQHLRAVGGKSHRKNLP
jgi:hypothetical protein